MSGYVRRKSKAKLVLIGNRNADVVSMSAPVAIHLGDILPSAAAGKSDLHKSANKDDLSGAKGQEFANLLLAAQEKGGSAASSTQAALEKEAQDLKTDDAAEAESVGDSAAADASSASLPTLTASLPTLSASLQTLTASLPTLNPVGQTLASPHTTSSKDAKDGVESASEAESSKTATRTEKAIIGTDSADPLLGVQGNVTEAVLLPPSLPVLMPTTKLASTAVGVEKGEQDSSGNAVIEKGMPAASATDKAVTEKGVDGVSSPVLQEQQAELSSKHAVDHEAAIAEAAGVTAGDAVAGSSAGEKPSAAGTAKAAGSTDLTGAKSSIDGASGVASSMNSAATADAVRDPAAVSSSTDLDQKTAASVAAAASPAATGSTAVPSHDVAASILPAGTHEVPAAPTPQTATTATHDMGVMTLKTDGLERTASSTSSGLGSTDAHALLDGTTTSGRNGTWQISSNRVEAGFANGQDSWTSVVAQRQQGHVTAMLEMGSASEHNSAASLLPQLNAHLVERQVPVDQLAVSVRQQSTLGQDASAANQGQQSNQSSQSQRGPQVGVGTASPVATAPAVVEGSRPGLDGNRISIRA
jgi:hypothetical protein